MAFEGLYRERRGKVRRPPSVVELGFWEAEVEAGGSFVAGPPPGAGGPGWVTA